MHVLNLIEKQTLRTNYACECFEFLLPDLAYRCVSSMSSEDDNCIQARMSTIEESDKLRLFRPAYLITVLI